MLEFTPDFETHVTSVDDQHREIIKLINDLSEMGAKSFTLEELTKTLNFLGDYAIRHFRDEEELMQKWKYPRYEAHKNMHKKFISVFGGLKAELAKEGPSVEFVFKVNKSIVNWIMLHIKQADKAMAAYIIEQSR